MTSFLCSGDAFAIAGATQRSCARESTSRLDRFEPP